MYVVLASSKSGANGRAKGNLDVNMLLQLEKAESGPGGVAGVEGAQSKDKGEGSEEVCSCPVLSCCCAVLCVADAITSGVWTRVGTGSRKRHFCTCT